MSMIVIDLPKSLWWSANGREHWARRAQKTRAVRRLARAAAQDAGRHQRASLSVLVHYPTNRTADPHNIASTVLKAAIDGVVDAGVLPDDDHTHLTAVTISRGPKTSVAGIYRLTLSFEEV